jgi:hypothetical protein
MGLFDHAIVYVPGNQDLWIDPTDEYARLGQLPDPNRETPIPYEVPAPQEVPQRLGAVLQVIYLVFNEGYSAGFLP